MSHLIFIIRHWWFKRDTLITVTNHATSATKLYHVGLDVIHMGHRDPASGAWLPGHGPRSPYDCR